MSPKRKRAGGARPTTGATTAPDSRAVALRALQAVRQGRNLPDGLLEGGLNALAPRDKAFARRLAQHAIRHRRRLLSVMAPRLKQPQPLLLDLLLLGAAQIDLPDIANHAAVHSTVELASRRLRGVVNAVLRGYLREDVPVTLTPAEQLSFPDWLYQQIRQDWGEQADAVMQALNAEPGLGLRINGQQMSASDYAQQLAEQGVEARVVGDEGVWLARAVSLTELPGYAQGQVSVQGVAAQQAARLLDLKPGLTVLDACAAPGGKTAHLLEREPKLQCVAVDVDEQRMQRLQDNLQRLGLQAECHVGDLTAQGDWCRPYDRIVLDAPCSGTGVIGRHPDIKWLRRARDVQALNQLQQTLLAVLWSLLKPGGQLLYCTCSILTSENDAQLDKFLAEHDDAEVDQLSLPLGQAVRYGWRIAPGVMTEGFYYARLSKRQVRC